MANFLERWISGEGKALKRLESKADAVLALADEMAALSDDALKAKTDEFKERYAKGETLDELLVEAFATAREAARRTIGEYPYRVQIMGAVAMHDGDIAEMRTGEGKTLTSTMCIYLNALAGKGVHVVTVNDYLAGRDAEWMGQIYRFLGMSVGVNSRPLSPAESVRLLHVILHIRPIPNWDLTICVITWLPILRIVYCVACMWQLSMRSIRF